MDVDPSALRKQEVRWLLFALLLLVVFSSCGVFQQNKLGPFPHILSTDRRLLVQHVPTVNGVFPPCPFLFRGETHQLLLQVAEPSVVVVVFVVVVVVIKMPAEGNGEAKAGEAAEAEKLPEQPAAAASAVVTASAAAAAAAAAETDGDAAESVAQGSTALASPILVFLNSASGGKMGPKVLEKIRALIPESQ